MGKKNKEWQKELKDSAQKIWLAGLGALAVAEEEGSKIFKNLVEKGETFEAEGKAKMSGVKEKVDAQKEKAEDQWNKVEEKVQESLNGLLGKMGVPSRDEINELNEKVEALTKLLEDMKKSAPKKTTRRTTRAKTSSTKTSSES